MQAAVIVSTADIRSIRGRSDPRSMTQAAHAHRLRAAVQTHCASVERRSDKSSILLQARSTQRSVKPPLPIRLVVGHPKISRPSHFQRIRYKHGIVTRNADRTGQKHDLVATKLSV